MKSVNDVNEAVRLISTEEFNYIVDDLRQNESGHLDLACLLGNTTPGTRIVAIASAGSLPDSAYWQDQGVDIFYAKTNLDLGIQLVADYNAGAL